MEHTNHIETLIGLWPSRQAFADEIGANVDAVHKWAKAGRIPSGWQAAVVSAASGRGANYATADWMLSVHAANGVSADQARRQPLSLASGGTQ